MKSLGAMDGLLLESLEECLPGTCAPLADSSTPLKEKETTNKGNPTENKNTFINLIYFSYMHQNIQRR